MTDPFTLHTGDCLAVLETLDRLIRPRCTAAVDVAKGWGVQDDSTLFGG